MSQIKEDLTGRRFDCLVVTGLEKGQWKCRCDCGQICFRDRCRLVKNNRGRKTKACGCKMHWQKGLSVTPTGVVWGGMIRRCFNKKEKTFSRYGGRGITVCEFLRSSVANLILAIGEKPQGKSIDRINNNGHYSCGACPECLMYSWPKNVRWADKFQQARNTSANRMITLGGMTKCVAEWAEYASLPYPCLLRRLKMKWPTYMLFAPANARLRRKAKQ